MSEKNWPHYPEDEISAVTRVLQSGKVNYWTGTECKDFEKEFAEYVGCKYAVSLVNGTIALELALYAQGVGPGDEVITTARTFVASASCIVARGATPVIADVDLTSQNITAETIRPLITPKTKAIIAVHLAGWPCDMDSIMELAREHNLLVIEDCAQAHGAQYKGKPVGSLGHVAAFSFCQDKIMSLGGEGGMLTTNDEALWKKAWAYKDHGKNYDTVFHKQHPPGFRWLHESFGTNWRMTEMQAAIGRVQLKKLPEWHAQRQAIAKEFDKAFSSLKGLRVVVPPKEIDHAYYRYYFFVEPSKLKAGWNRDRIMQTISQQGIPCFSGSCSEIYLEKCFVDAELGPKKHLPVAKILGEISLMLALHPTLTTEDIFASIKIVRAVLRNAVL